MCACAHAVCGQVPRYTASRRVLSDGLGGNQHDSLLQRCPTRRPHGAGNVLSCFATRAEAFQGGIQERRNGSLRIYRLSLWALWESRPTRLKPLPSSGESQKTSASWSTPPRPWLLIPGMYAARRSTAEHRRVAHGTALRCSDALR